MNTQSQKLKVTEIYLSVQGESSFAGLPCVFVRLTGCPLRCRWCDTSYAFAGGKEMSFEEIFQAVANHDVPMVELTGGEPLAQEGAYALVKELCDKGFQVLIETSGSEPIEDVDERAHVIMDIKCPGSKMQDRNRYKNIEHLRPHHEVKFVIADRADFEWAAEMISQHTLARRCTILLSPAFGLLEAKLLVDWMLEARIPARLNLQQHKFIWSPRKRGV